MFLIPPCSPPEGATSPFVYADGVFNENELSTIDDIVARLNLVGGETQTYYEGYRKSLVSFFDVNENTEWLFSKLGHTIHQLNSKYYRFNLSVLDSIQYAFYDSEFGGKYDWHHDYNEGLSPSRKLTVVVQLSNPEEYEGGELELFPDVQVPKKRGLVAMFPSYSYHRVTPIVSGQRKVLVGWIWGPPFC